jgi:hypothetical protein
METIFEVIVQLTVEDKDGDLKARPLSTQIAMNAQSNLDRTAYVNPDGTPTEAGGKVITEVLLRGLIGHIHAMKEIGVRNDVEHVRYIIDKIEDGFAQVTQVSIDKLTPLP